MDKSEILKIVLVNEISNEIEEKYLSKEISKEQYKQIFVERMDLIDTVPSAVGQDFFNQKLEELVNANYLFLSDEIRLDGDDSFNEKDIAFYLIDSDNDVPEKYQNAQHINLLNEHLLWNVSNACVDHFLIEKE